MSVVSEKYRSIVIGLIKATKAKAIDWNTNSDGDPWVDLGGFHILIRESRNANGEDLYVFDLLDMDWKVAERFDDENLIGTEAPYDYGDWFNATKSLRELAIRAANKSDDAVDAILDALKDFTSNSPWS